MSGLRELRGRERRKATGAEFRAEWLATGDVLDGDVDGWIDCVRKGGLMAFPDGALLVLVEIDQGRDGG